MSKITNDQELTEFVDKWAAFLGLRYWRIRAFFEPKLEIEVNGRVYWESKLNDATILINPYLKLEGPNIKPIEVVVLHELFHLHFAVLGDHYNSKVEDSVDAMAWALYKALIKNK